MAADDAHTEAILLTLPQVIDVALTTPEVGIVDHRLLANILKVICEKLNLDDVKLQYKGTQAAQIEKIWKPLSEKTQSGTKVSGLDKEQIVVIPEGPTEKFPVMTVSITRTEIQNMQNHIKKLQKDIASIQGGRVPSVDLNADTVVGFVASEGQGEDLEGAAPSSDSKLQQAKFQSAVLVDMTSQEAIDYLYKEMKNTRSLVDELVDKVEILAEADAKRASDEHDELMKQISEKFAELDYKINECIVQINKMDTIFSTSYNDMMNNLTDVENSVKILSEKALKDAGKADIEEHLLETVQTVNHKLTAMETSSTKLSEAVALLLEENTIKQAKFMNILEELDRLAADKIGREEFAESLAEKVDLCMINRKVSNDQFNATCDDLSKGIEEALEKLVAQEDLWHVALREIQQEINQKLCKDDLIPVQDLMTEKLKELHRRMKVLAIMKEEREAAVSKKYFIKDVQCISCDRDVIMRKKTDESSYPGALNLLVQKSKAPQISYELDDLRKQQQQSPYGKKINIFQEAAIHRPRYCGGAHTITTPQQRTSRLSSFGDTTERTVEKRPRLSGSLTGIGIDQAEKEKSAERLSDEVKKVSKVSIGTSLEKIEEAVQDETDVEEEPKLEETLKTSKVSLKTSSSRVRSVEKDMSKEGEEPELERKKSSKLSSKMSAQKVSSAEKDIDENRKGSKNASKVSTNISAHKIRSTDKDLNPEKEGVKIPSRPSLVTSPDQLEPDLFDDDVSNMEAINAKKVSRASLNLTQRNVVDETKELRKSYHDAISSLEKVAGKDRIQEG